MMEKFKKLVIFAFLCSWALFIPSLASATLITGSGPGTVGTISASADFTFTTHDFGSGSVNAFQIVLTNTSAPTTVRGNLLTGFFWTFSGITSLSTGIDGLAATVVLNADGSSTSSNVDIAPAVKSTPTVGTYQLSNGPFGTANSGQSYSAYEYGIGTVGYGLAGFGGNDVDGDDYGIMAAGSLPLSGGVAAALPLIQTSATFWIPAPTGVTSLPDITNFSFAFGSLPDNRVDAELGKVPEPMTLILYGFGFAGAGLYRHLRRKPK